MKLKQKVLTYKILCGVLGLAVIIVGVNAVNAYSGSDKVSTVIENADTINITNETSEETFGANSGPRKYQRQFFLSGYQSGGDRYATSSTASTYTLTATEFNGDKTYIDWNAGLNTTLTTMATTSMDFMGIPYAGDERSYWFRSATTTAATTITLAAGTGVDIHHGDSTGDDLVIDGLDLAKLTFIRKADTDVLLVMEKFTEGD